MTLLNSKAGSIALVAVVAGLALVLASTCLFHAGHGLAASAADAPAITRDSGSQDGLKTPRSALPDADKTELPSGLTAAYTQHGCCSNEATAMSTCNTNQSDMASRTDKLQSDEAASPSDPHQGHAMANPPGESSLRIE